MRRRLPVLAIACLLLVPLLANAETKPFVLVVVGAEGAPEYGDQFRRWAEQWQSAAKEANAECSVLGLSVENDGTSDRDQLRAQLANRASAPAQPLWLILIGHGTYDGKTARFNLRGADVTPDDLRNWLQPLSGQVAVLNCASSSGPFMAGSSKAGRVVITSTKSGHEYNFSRFGGYLSTAITDKNADLDKDGQTSLLEAYLLASANLREFYSREARLATEHALLDDNGDGLGTPPEWFKGLRPTKTAASGASPDGQLANRFVLVQSQAEEHLPEAIRARRDELEQELANLRTRKSQLAEDEYFKLLEPLLLEIARLYQEADNAKEAQDGAVVPSDPAAKSLPREPIQ